MANDITVLDDEVRALFGRCTDVAEINKIKMNDPGQNDLLVEVNDAEKMEVSQWERLGAYIAGNDHLQKLDLDYCGIDDSKMEALFGELTSSGSLKKLLLGRNSFGLDGVRSMAPFLKRSSSLTHLSFTASKRMDTECFDLLLRSLSGGPVEKLYFDGCNINSFETLEMHTLPTLRKLFLRDNGITGIPLQLFANYTGLVELALSNNELGEGGFRSVANLLRNEGSCLEILALQSTGMGNAGAEIIADSLQCNTKLHSLSVHRNEFGPEGLKAFLRLLIDVSSIKAAAHSNHTLRFRHLDFDLPVTDYAKEIAAHIEYALFINGHNATPDAAARDKIRKILFVRKTRMEFSRLQGIEHSSDHCLFEGIDPVLLPDVLELVGHTNKQSELYQMLVAIAPDLVSLINRKAMLEETVANHKARMAAIAEEHAKLEGATARMEMQLTTIEAEVEGAKMLSGTKRGRDTAP